jgi:Helix-turn-helix domain
MSHSALRNRAVKAKVNPFEVNRRVFASDLSPGCKLVVLAILDHARYGRGKCFASIQTLGRETGLSPRQIRRYFGRLESEEWIQSYRCRLCNAAEDLNVHHRSYEHLGAEPDRDVITLCRDCHAKFHDKDVQGGAP